MRKIGTPREVRRLRRLWRRIRNWKRNWKGWHWRGNRKLSIGWQKGLL